MKTVCAVLLAVLLCSGNTPADTVGDMNRRQFNGPVLFDTTRHNPNLPLVNINYMLRGHFYASSPHVEYLAGYGGWGDSDNHFGNVDSLGVGFKEFQVYIDTTVMGDLGNGHAAYNVYVVNKNVDTVFFSAQDSRLYMIVEAKDKSGDWRPIEYLPSSWCGNSYHTLFLPAGKYWSFKTPVHKGKIKTSLRVKLQYGLSAGAGKSNIVYSNVISGSVNKGQFDKKLKYRPHGIMDPYLE